MYSKLLKIEMYSKILYANLTLETNGFNHDFVYSFYKNLVALQVTPPIIQGYAFHDFNQW